MSLLGSRNSNLSAFNAININYSTLAGSTITLTSTMVSLGQSTNKIYTTLAQGNYSTATNWISTNNTMSTGKVVAMSANAQTQLVVTQLSTVSSLYYTSTLGQNWSSTLSAASGLPLNTQTIYSAGAVSGNGQYAIVAASGGYLYTSNNSGASFTNTNTNTPAIYLPFETTPVNGAIGGTTLTVTGSPALVTGIVGSKAVNLANTTGGIAANYIRGTWSGATNFTISFWFNLQSVGNHTLFITSPNNLVIQVSSSGILQYYSSTGINILTSLQITTNTWYNLTAIYQAAGLCSLYINNALIGQGTTNSGAYTITAFNIGCYDNANGALNGYIDDLKIYNSAITFNPIVPANWSNVAVSNSGQYMLATATNGGLFMSSNSGVTWSQITSELLAAAWSSLAISATGQYMLAYSAPVTVPPQLTGLSSNTWQVNGISWTSSASSIYTALYPAYAAFNNYYGSTQPYSWASTSIYSSTGVYSGSVSTTIIGVGTKTGEWLQLQSSVPIIMYSYTFACGGNSGLPQTYWIVGSNDGLNWYPIQSAAMAANPFGSSNNGNNFGTCTTYLLVNSNGTQTLTGSNGSGTGATTVNVVTTTYSTTLIPYTYFRILCTVGFNPSSTLFELGEWYINFNAGGQNYSTNYGSTWQNGYALTTPTLALSGNGQYALGANTTPSVYIINNYLQGFTSNNNILAVFSPVLTASSIVAAALSNTGQYMVLVTSNTTGANVYYSVNYGTSFLGMLIGSVAMAGCTISADGSYITVTNGTTIYQLNNNSNGFSLAVGNNAGVQNQGQNAIALGNQAGTINQTGNSIILNASGSTLNSYTQGFYVAPIAASSSSTLYNLLGYGTDNQVVQTGLSLGSTVSSQTIYGEWIQYQLTTAVSITSYALVVRPNTAQRYPPAWTLVGSTDGVNWSVLDAQISGVGFGTYTLKAASPIYSYFRVIFTQVNANSGNVIDIGQFLLYNNNNSIFSTYTNYSVVQSGLYNILQYNSVTVCITTFSWPTTQVTNALGIAPDLGGQSLYIYQPGWLPAPGAVVGNSSYFLGFAAASLGTAYEYNSNLIATQGTATIVNSTNVYLNGSLTLLSSGNVGIGSTIPQYALDVNGITRSTALQYSDGSITLSAAPTFDYTTFGQNWVQLSLTTSSVWYGCSLSYSGQYQLLNVASGSGAIWYSLNYGQSWTQASITTSNFGKCYVSGSGQYQLVSVNSPGGVVYVSSNYGVTWTIVSITASNITGTWLPACISYTGQYMSIAMNSAGSYIYYSNTYGQTWTQTSISSGYSGLACSASGQYQIACANTNGSAGFLYLSINYGASWTSVGSSQSWSSVCVSATGQYMTATFGVWPTTYAGGIYYSSNYGQTWTLSNAGASADYQSVSCSASGQYQMTYAFVSPNYTSTVYYSSNYGQTWTAASGSYVSMSCITMSGNGQYALATVNAGGVYQSVTKYPPLYLNGTTNVAGNINLTGSILYNGVAITTGTGSIWTAGSGGAAYYNGGSVGIGTNNPLVPLHLFGSNGLMSIKNNSGSSTVSTYFYFHNSDESSTGFIGIDGTGLNNTYPSAFCMGSVSNTPVYIGVAQYPKLTISTAGYVGIGTTVPSNLLTVGASAYPAVSNAGTTNLLIYGNICCYRNRLIFSNAVTDWNHCIYNNGPNADGEGVWDGMKFNVYNGAWFRVGNANGAVPTTAMYINSSGSVGIGTTVPNALLTCYGNSNLGSSASSVTTVAGTLNQISGQSGGPYAYQSQWDTASTSTHTVGFISQLNSYTGGPYAAVTLFNNMMGIITIYVRNTALTGYSMTQFLVGHASGAPTVASQLTNMTYSSGAALYISYSFDGVSTGNIFVNTNQGGTSPSIQVCWTMQGAT